MKVFNQIEMFLDDTYSEAEQGYFMTYCKCVCNYLCKYLDIIKYKTTCKKINIYCSKTPQEKTSKNHPRQLTRTNNARGYLPF